MSAASGAGWFPVARQDVQTIQDHAGEGGAGLTLSVWLALLNLANTERSEFITVHIGRVARLCGYSYRATATALRQLAAAGLVTITPRKLDGTHANDASMYELNATVSPCTKNTQGAAKIAQPSVNHNGGTLPTGINKDTSVSYKQENKRESACALTPDTFYDAAVKANGGRLSANELERFVGYWTETDAKGKCRFQEQKFFAMSRRIATWAARDGRRQPEKATGFVRMPD